MELCGRNRRNTKGIQIKIKGGQDERVNKRCII